MYIYIYIYVNHTIAHHILPIFGGELVTPTLTLDALDTSQALLCNLPSSGNAKAACRLSPQPSRIYQGYVFKYDIIVYH
jgi:hypothetical protein